MSTLQLGVDFGTSTTVAVLSGPDGRPRPLVFDGTELLPSAVCADEAGTLLVGRDAVHAARAYPGGYEPHPKRSVDDGTLLLGGREFAVADVFSAVLRRVADEAERAAGGKVPGAVLTCPAGWGARRQAVLAGAAVQAGLPRPRLLAEPVAAACSFAGLAGAAPQGARLLVYDLGAGTFDASVVRAGGDGFEVLAEHGLPDAGGLDIDAAVAGHLGAVYAQRDAAAWQRLTRPETPADRRAAHAFREDVRIGKEMLSRSASTLLHVPIFDDDALLTRVQLEQLALPILERTMRATQTALRESGLGPGDLAGVFMVGGASRMPLAATLLHRRLGVAPMVVERPELVVAEGSLLASPSVTAEVAPAPIVVSAPPAPVAPIVVSAPPGPVAAVTEAAAEPAPLPPAVPAAPRRRSRLLLAGVLAGVVAAGAVTVTAVLWSNRDRGSAASSSGYGSNSGYGGGAAKAETSPLVFTLTGHTGDVTGLAFLHDRAHLVSSSNDGTMRVWNMPAGTSEGPFTSGHGGYCVAVSPDATVIATGGNSDHTARLWSVRGENTATLTGHDQWVRTVAFSPDGKTLVTGSFDNTARLWDVPTGKLKATLQGHTEAVYDAAFAPDGRTVATASADGTIRLWDVASGRTQRTLETGWTGVNAVAYAPDGRTLAAAGYGNTGGIEFWNVATGALARATLEPTTTFEVVRYSPDAHHIAAATGNGARIYDPSTGAVTATLDRHTKKVESLAYNMDGTLLATGSDDRSIRVWRAVPPAAAAPVASAAGGLPAAPDSGGQGPAVPVSIPAAGR
ncbi:Hsp70 family protein [Dactylosporangium sp. CA-139066]|uniref:Hsp70 family protein n=1 Tax=Dactylosporangium sp. CA-139066 TaxID=3239930 RepID=UPI003D8B094C